MAYDERLAERIRRALGQPAGSTEKKMFGALAFLLGGKMCCGIVMDRRLTLASDRLERSRIGVSPRPRPRAK